jgi:hypothetical protein
MNSGDDEDNMPLTREQKGVPKEWMQMDSEKLVRKSVKRDLNRWGTWTPGVILVVRSHGSSSTAEHTNRGRREKRRLGRAFNWTRRTLKLHTDRD